MDCGFLRLPTVNSELETVFLEADPLMAIIPENHPLADCTKFPVQELVSAPFLLLSRGANSDATDIFSNCGLNPKVHIMTWDDYAIMSMVEKGLGISVLPQLILQRIPYHILTKELDVPAYRRIGLALRSKKTASLAVKRFLEYLQYR